MMRVIYIYVSLYRAHESLSIRASNGRLALLLALRRLISNMVDNPTIRRWHTRLAASMTRSILSHNCCNVPSSAAGGSPMVNNVFGCNPSKCCAYPTRPNHALASFFWSSSLILSLAAIAVNVVPMSFIICSNTCTFS
ncbi:hypothetical protein IF1G_11245 [Cordyceps javanica]|uniref:Uncharacterized protein n=1 Tax=Cordyceps javanica TaxID=43265 RepID=A0A545UKW6_9HYPO|nr:hypothetical protein IF1G_11245 [Cordyceps javanica]